MGVSMKAGLTILSPLVPYPPHSGGAGHISNAIRQLSESYLIQLYALAAAPESVRWGSLAEWCAEVYAFRPTPRAAFTLDPPAVRRTFSAELVSRAHSDWSQRPPAIVQLEFSDMAQYAPLARQYGALVVCTAHNVAFLAQVRRARQQRGLALQARRWLGALSLWLYELRALRRCHLIVTLSEIDAAMFKALASPVAGRSRSLRR
ncbi:MAG: hypothetical protein KatS3mg057_1320 [Herpetosiphonaceae bacterium]|nr:MAG: hypothetical protein KatS3mg057_1320 [Herpetosiphonaceae bacterium]